MGPSKGGAQMSAEAETMGIRVDLDVFVSYRCMGPGVRRAVRYGARGPQARGLVGRRHRRRRRSAGVDRGAPRGLRLPGHRVLEGLQRLHPTGEGTRRRRRPEEGRDPRQDRRCGARGVVPVRARLAQLRRSLPGSDVQAGRRSRPDRRRTIGVDRVCSGSGAAASSAARGSTRAGSLAAPGSCGVHHRAAAIGGRLGADAVEVSAA